MTTHGSATSREETPHEIATTNTPVDSSKSTVEKIEALAEIICGAGRESTAALFVLMGTLQNSPEPEALANSVKHYAFTRCGEFNVFGMVDAQVLLQAARRCIRVLEAGYAAVFGSQIGKAIETHDLGSFRKQVDLRSVANRLIDDAMNERKQEGGSNAVGQTMVEILRPRIVGLSQAQIERFVETGQFKSEKETEGLVTKDPNDMRNRIGPIAYTQIDGKVELVGLTVRPVDGKKPIVVNLKMRQASDGYWRVMEVQVPK